MKQGNRKFVVFVLSIAVFMVLATTLIVTGKDPQFISLGTAVMMMSGAFMAGNYGEHKSQKKQLKEVNE